MPKPKRKKQASKARRRATGGPPRPELKAGSRAQLGRDPEQRAYRPRDEDASVEDPLHDWPEEE
jgi:hypothetical protein